MRSIKAIWKKGHLVPAEPVDWPEGSELLVEPIAGTCVRVGLDEADWRDDPEALADWDVWLGTIEPLQLSDEERASMDGYRAEFKKHNLEAVRRQMESGEL